jgi:hypothetical protein
MKRMLSAVGAMTGVLLMTSVAQAQTTRGGDFGKQGEFIISADRLVPFFNFTHISVDGPTGGTVTKNTTTYTQTGFSLLWGSTSNGGVDPGFYTVPRVGFDYVIVPNVTIGGDLVVFATLGGSKTTDTTTSAGGTVTNSSVSVDNPSTTIFGIAPRGGYILGLNDLFSLWLRGGFSYYTSSTKATATSPGGTTTTTTDNAHQLGLDLEPQFVFTPVQHIGFTAGLNVDIPLTGGVSTDTTTTTPGATASSSTSFSASILNIGVSLGMLGHF